MVFNNDALWSQAVDRMERRMYEGETERLARDLRAARRFRSLRLPKTRRIRRLVVFGRFHPAGPGL